MWYSLGKEYPEMVWLPKPKHIGCVFRDISGKVVDAQETEFQRREVVHDGPEPRGQDILQDLKQQIRERKLYLKHEIIKR